MSLMNQIGVAGSKVAGRVKGNIETFMFNHQDLVKPVVAAGLAASMLTSQVLAAGTYNPSGGVKVMVGYVCSILMGVGIIYALIAIFNWVSAIKQEDAERQSKSIVNVFIAGLLIAVKPISVAIINAMGGSDATSMIE